MPKTNAPKTASPRKPSPSDRTFEKARAYFRDGDYGAALAFANQILARDPDNPGARRTASPAAGVPRQPGDGCGQEEAGGGESEQIAPREGVRFA